MLCHRCSFVCSGFLLCSITSIHRHHNPFQVNSILHRRHLQQTDFHSTFDQHTHKQNFFKKYHTALIVAELWSSFRFLMMGSWWLLDRDQIWLKPEKKIPPNQALPVTINIFFIHWANFLHLSFQPKLVKRSTGDYFGAHILNHLLVSMPPRVHLGL